MVEIRPFRQEDWAVLLDLANQAVPFAPQANIEWLDKRKAFDASRRIRRHFVAIEDDLPVGYSCIEQQSDDPVRMRIYVVCSPDHLHGEVGTRLYETVLQCANELGVRQFWAQEYQDDQPVRRFLTGQGFQEVRRFTLPGNHPMVIYQLDLEY
jgi:N-acetylglutamate synthase-like GNAT family acetyltransferase